MSPLKKSDIFVSSNPHRTHDVYTGVSSSRPYTLGNLHNGETTLVREVIHNGVSDARPRATVNMRHLDVQLQHELTTTPALSYPSDT